MSSKLVRKAVCLLLVAAMVLSTFLVLPLGFAGRSGTGTYEIDGLIMYHKTQDIDAPVAGATVILYNLTTGVQRVVTSDDNGYFIFDNVPPGHYQVIAKPPSINHLTIDGLNGSRSGIIEIDDKSKGIEPLFLKKVPSTPEPIYTLQGYVGHVVDGNFYTLANASVTLKSQDYLGYTISAKKTNETGEYIIETFRGLYWLWATADDYQYNITEIDLNKTQILNYNITLPSNESLISGYITFIEKPEGIKGVSFLYDIDHAEYIQNTFPGTHFLIKAYHGNFTLILHVPGYQPYYYPNIIKLNATNNSFKLPPFPPLQLTNDEKIVTTLTFPGNNWNNVHFTTDWTLNHDSEIFGLTLVDYGDPVTIGCPRFQVDNEPVINGNSNGEVDASEVTNFTAWLNKRGPYHLYTNEFFKITNASLNEYTYFNWKKSSLDVSTSGFAGAYDSSNSMVITTKLDYNSNKKLDSTKYKIRFGNLRPNEVVVFNLPSGYEISNVESYDNETVWVKAYDKCQINDSVIINVEKLKDPTADIYVPEDSDYVTDLENITFNASGSLPGSGKIIDYSWNFADGTTGSGLEVEHNYTDAGVFNVTLEVTTQAGLSDTDWIEITVDNTKPVGVIEFQNETGVTINEGLENIPAEDYIITFNASKSTDTIDGSTKGNIVSYFWTFGDTTGTTGGGAVTNHSYDHPGTYEVTLNVTDSAGHYSVKTREIKILDREAPEPKLKVLTHNGGVIRICHIDKWIILNASISTDNFDDVENLTFKWDLNPTDDSDGDGIPDNDADATGPIYNLTPERTGRYPIALWITDTSGNVANTTGLPADDWTVDIMGTNLRFAPIQEEINKYIKFSREKPKEGEKVKYTVNVTNLNDVTAWDVIVRFFVDGKQKDSKSIKKLEQNDFELVKFTWKASGVDKKHNISFNVTLESNESFEQIWDDNDRSMHTEVISEQLFDTGCLITVVIIVIIVVVVIVYFYRRRQQEKAELGKRRGKKGKRKEKEKGKKKEKKGKKKD